MYISETQLNGEEKVVLTNFNPSTIADIRKRRQRRLRRVTSAVLRNRARHVLGTAHALDVRRVGVRVDSAEEAARRRSNSDGSKREERRDEEGFGEHLDGIVDSNRSKSFSRCLDGKGSRSAKKSVRAC